MHIIKAETYRQVPWKNGGGTTAEIIVFPPDATMADFDWRLSMADVASDGPFSTFPGIDRTLTLLEGRGMDLAIEGQGDVRLNDRTPPLAFPGDVPVMARLVDGPIRDLNVMTRRERVLHTVEALALDGQRDVSVEGGTALLFCREGHAEVNGAVLGRFDTLVSGPATLHLSGQGRFCLVLLQEI